MYRPTPEIYPWSSTLFRFPNTPLRHSVHRRKLGARLELLQEIAVHQTQPCREAITIGNTNCTSQRPDGAAFFFLPVIYLVYQEMCRHKPDAAIELDESSMIHKKAHLVIPDLCQLPFEFIDGTRKTQSFVSIFHLSIYNPFRKEILPQICSTAMFHQLDTVTSCRQIPASLEQWIKAGARLPSQHFEHLN